MKKITYIIAALLVFSAIMAFNHNKPKPEFDDTIKKVEKGFNTK